MRRSRASFPFVHPILPHDQGQTTPTSCRDFVLLLLFPSTPDSYAPICAVSSRSSVFSSGGRARLIACCLLPSLSLFSCIKDWGVFSPSFPYLEFARQADSAHTRIYRGKIRACSGTLVSVQSAHTCRPSLPTPQKENANCPLSIHNGRPCPAVDNQV
ncbi:hypothetical protein B0T19DRAFT_216441 [Cercophora scortea]|uniref:Uncharacterized protein n=1 Tax=Cercophora scortea TaxID=314031 RepID=A0AAE0M935_9PEZI|nr:hypothetical protein B0T19DRAFT_216441 [Cercophora scortea]